MTHSSPARIVLRKAVERKKKDFRKFSIRWLAGQVGVSHAYLSQILSGKRDLPMRLVEPLSRHLDLDAPARASIVSELVRANGIQSVSPVVRRKSRQIPIAWDLAPIKDFDLLTRWEYFAILQCTKLDGFDGSAEFVANELLLPKATVEATFLLLQKRGYLEADPKQGIRMSKAFFEFQSRGTKDQLRSYHKSVLQKARDVLETQQSEKAVSQRLITSATVTCSSDRVEELKLRFAEFLRDFVEEASESDSSDVIYQIGIQFFPVSRP